MKIDFCAHSLRWFYISFLKFLTQKNADMLSKKYYIWNIDDYLVL